MKNIFIYTHRLFNDFDPLFDDTKSHRMEELKSTDDGVTHDRDGYALFFVSSFETTTNTGIGKTTTPTKSRSGFSFSPTQAHVSERGEKILSGKFLLLIKTTKRIQTRIESTECKFIVAV
jgi:hypothetical protein